MKPLIEPARRGEVWLAALGAGRPGEIGKTRPVLVVSVDEVATGGEGEPVIVVPFTSSRAPSLLRPTAPPGLGLERGSAALARAVRPVARGRLLEPLGEAPPSYVNLVAGLVSALIGGPRTEPSPGA